MGVKRGAAIQRCLMRTHCNLWAGLAAAAAAAGRCACAVCRSEARQPTQGPVTPPTWERYHGFGHACCVVL